MSEVAPRTATEPTSERYNNAFDMEHYRMQLHQLLFGVMQDSLSGHRLREPRVSAVPTILSNLRDFARGQAEQTDDHAADNLTELEPQFFRLFCLIPSRYLC